jgi:fibronectin-binding autotransporter adhesin
MTNDAGPLTLNSMTFNSGSPVYTLGGTNALTFVSNSSGGLPQIVSNSANSVTMSLPLTLTNSLIVSGSGNVALSGAIGGAGSVTMSGSGILSLSNTSNTFSGGVNLATGTVAIPADGALGTGPVTFSSTGTLAYSATTATGKTFVLNGGTLAANNGVTLSLNGGIVTGGILDGGGTFATNATNGAQFIAITATPSVAITSNSAKDQFVHFDSSAAFTVAAGVNTGGTSTTLNLNGFTNEGIGTVTIGAGSEINVANFQSYGTMIVTPATGSQTTMVTNQGSSALGFNGGSQTFLGTPATAPGPSGPYLDGVDLHGHNLVLTGGLFVNNGFTVDSTGNSSIIVGYGALYKGAGTNFVPIVTQNGGKFSAGNSPGISPNGSLVIGPGQLNTFDWQINDAGPSATHPTAPGVAGPSADTNGNVSGWSVIASEMLTSPIPPHPLSSGNLTWTASATPGNQFDFQLETLQGPTTPVGTSIDGPMADFDPTQKYVWPFITWQGTYSGPTDTATLTADTLIDTSMFANSLGTTPGGFTIQFDGANKAIDLVYTPVPEPGTLALGSLAGLGLGRMVRRRRTRAAAAHDKVV